eukprot:8930464-Ditylum_brightwellii.AAC.1
MGQELEEVEGHQKKHTGKPYLTAVSIRCVANWAEHVSVAVVGCCEYHSRVHGKVTWQERGMKKECRGQHGNAMTL